MSKKKLVDTQALAARRLMEFLKGEKFEQSSPVFGKVLEFLKKFPVELTAEERDKFKLIILERFDLDEQELMELLKEPVVEVLHPETAEGKNGDSRPVEENQDVTFKKCLEPEGFVSKYIELTKSTEPPLPFHIMSMLCICGGSFRRRLFVKKGFYNVYPNVSIVLLAPAGLCKKGAAVSLARMLVSREQVNVLAEKLTPEVLVESLKKEELLTGYAGGLLYGPELSVLFGKQRYNEGMIPLINELIECKDTWTSSTICRGEVTLTQGHLSLLGASTIDLFQTSMPPAAFDGGLISRILLVAQHRPTRRVAFPEFDFQLLDELKLELLSKEKFQGEVKLSKDAFEFYRNWYDALRDEEVENSRMRTMRERKPDHVLRVSMVLHLLQHSTLEICSKCLFSAIRILEYLDLQLPKVFAQMAETRSGEDAAKILDVLNSNGGQVDHSTMMRKLQYRMTAKQLREQLNTLKEGNQVKEVRTTLEHYYVLKRKD